MRKEEEKQDNLIEIPEDVRVPGSDVILEKGDRIKVESRSKNKRSISESVFSDMDMKEIAGIIEREIEGGVDPGAVRNTGEAFAGELMGYIDDEYASEFFRGMEVVIKDRT